MIYRKRILNLDNKFYYQFASISNVYSGGWFHIDIDLVPFYIYIASACSYKLQVKSPGLYNLFYMICSYFAQ